MPTIPDTKLAKKFVKVREILEEGDLKTIEKNLSLIQSLYIDANRQIEKFIKTDDNDLCVLNAGDIKDLCDAAAPLLAQWEKKINHNTMYKALWDCEKLTDDHFRPWAQKYTQLFNVVAKLRCFLSVMSYNYCVLDAYEKQWNQNNDLATVIKNTVRNYIKDGY